MPIVINTNVPSLIARNALNKATNNLTKALEHLSTGSRISSAADDPAGSYVASKISSKLRGSVIAANNVQMGYNMVESASNDYQAIETHLNRIRDLATQFANNTLSATEQDAIKNEVQQRYDEINRIAAESEFNDLKILDGSRTSVQLQVGPNSGDAVTISDVFANSTTTSLGLTAVNTAFASASSASTFIGTVDSALSTVSSKISSAGAWMSRLSSMTELLTTQSENLADAYSTIADADIAQESANYTKNQLLQQTAAAMVAQASQITGVLALQLVQSLT